MSLWSKKKLNQRLIWNSIFKAYIYLVQICKHTLTHISNVIKTFLYGLNPNMERGILVVNSLDTHSQFNKTLLSMQNEKKRRD